MGIGSGSGDGFNFKSHHSGMETYSYLYGLAEQNGFKSHHSGMETRRRRRWGGVLPPL